MQVSKTQIGTKMRLTQSKNFIVKLLSYLIIDLHIRNLLICLFICSLSCLFILIDNASAQTVPQQYLEVSPIIQDLTLFAGKTISYPLIITNKGDKPVGFHIDVTGIDPTSDSTVSTATLNSPILSWISVDTNDLIVPPHSKNAFKITITTPKNAKSSGYYATLFLTPFISNPLQPSGPIVLERIGALVFATIGDLNYNDLAQKVKITSFAFNNSLQTPQSINFDVSNSYFTHFIAKPFLTFTTFQGKKTTIYPTEKHVLPGSSRFWNIPINLPWYTLYAQANLAVSIGDGKQLFAQTTFVNYPLVFLTVFIFCIILFVLKRRKKFKRAISILLSGHE